MSQSTLNQSTADTVDTIMAGTEPSIDLKRRAKELAWQQHTPRETRHRIFRRDARQMKGIEEAVHLVVTSPPYFNLVEYESGSKEGQLGGVQDYDVFLSELDRVWARCHELLVPGGRVCIVVGDVCLSRRQAGRHHVLPLHAEISLRCRNLGFDYLTPILWAKIANATTEVGGANRFLGKPYEPNGIIKNDIEYILLLRKAGGYRNPSSLQRALSLLEPEEHMSWYRSVWTDIRGASRTSGHPAPYPTELAFRLIKLFSFVGDTVLDPFWGTGSTTSAAIQAARSSVGFEIEEKYIHLGRERLAQVDAIVPAHIEFCSS